MFIYIFLKVSNTMWFLDGVWPSGIDIYFGLPAKPPNKIHRTIGSMDTYDV